MQMLAGMLSGSHEGHSEMRFWRWSCLPPSLTHSGQMQGKAAFLPPFLPSQPGADLAQAKASHSPEAQPAAPHCSQASSFPQAQEFRIQLIYLAHVVPRAGRALPLSGGGGDRGGGVPRGIEFLRGKAAVKPIGQKDAVSFLTRTKRRLLPHFGKRMICVG